MTRQEPATERVLADPLPIVYAAQHARNLVTDACLRWGFDDLMGPAAVIATELVTNAVRHAHTFMTLEIAARPRVLYVAVRDGSRSPPLRRSDRDSTEPGGRGLRLVSAFSSAWRYTPHNNGKTVWATLPMAPRQQPDHGRAQPWQATWQSRARNRHARDGPYQVQVSPRLPTQDR